MLAMDAIILLIKLKYIDKIIDNNLELYNNFLNNYKNEDFLFPKLDLENNKLHIRNFIVLSEKREDYINKGL
jgi:hypothetical protein